MQKNANHSLNAYLPTLFYSVAAFCALLVLALLRDRASGQGFLFSKIFSDAALLTGLGFLFRRLLAFIRREGGFTAFSYAFAFVKNALFPTKKQENYASYRKRRENERKEKSPDCNWQIGLFYIALSLLPLF